MADGQDPTAPPGLDFSHILSWHLFTRGTRLADPDRDGVAWGKTEFADRFGMTDRAVSYWTDGEREPDDLVAIERELFGRSAKVAPKARAQLREALVLARAERKKRRRAAKPEPTPPPDPTRPPPKSDRFLSIGSLFKGRADAMARLRASLLASGRAAVTAKAHALHGLGGLGKTRLAIEYGLAHEQDYSALLFLTGETPAALEASLQGLAEVLEIPSREKFDEAQRRSEALAWLKRHPNWLMVIDNLDTPEALQAAEGLLAHLSKGHVVVTTRLARFSAHFEPLELDVLGLDASVEFLFERARPTRRRVTPDDAADARAIAIDLGRLALTLEIAAAYIETKRQSFADFRRDWARQRGAVLDWHSPEVTGYPRAVAAAMMLSIQQLPPPARALLEHLACLAPEPAPESLIDAPIPGFDGDARVALEEIEGYSLVRREGDRPAFTMHRVTQDVVRRGLAADEAETRCVATLYWLIAAIDPALHSEPGGRRAAVLAVEAHVAAAAGRADSDAALDAGRWLLVETGEAFHEAGYLERAGRFYATTLDLATRLAERRPSDADRQNNIAAARSRIGDVLVSQGNLPEALTSYRAGLSIAESLAKSDPGNAGWRRDLSVSYDRVGDVLVSQGNLPEALTSYRAGLSIAESLAKSDPGNAGWRRDLSVSYDRVGDVLVSQGNLPEALTSYRAGLSIAESLAKSDPGNAGWQYDLGIFNERIGDVQTAQGDLVTAFNSYEKKLSIVSRLVELDPRNAGWRRDLSVSYDRVGDVLVSQGNLPEALTSYRAGLSIAESLAKSDPGNAGWRRDLSVSYDRVGDVLVSQGNLPEALTSYRAGLSIRESLAKSDPGNAGWQRDLIVSCVKLTEVFPGEGRVMLTRAGAIADRLRDEGRLAPVDAWIPDEIARMLAALPGGEGGG